MRPPPAAHPARGEPPSPWRPSPVLVFCGCFALLLLLGWVDYITGYELGFFVFYSLPVGLAAWYLGRWPGILLSLAATVTWWLADAYAGAKYSSPFSFWWNSSIHFAAFVINAVTIAKIKADITERDALAVKLEDARQALQAAASALPTCPVCGKTHSPGATEAQAALKALAQTNPALRVALCEECARSPGAR